MHVDNNKKTPHVCVISNDAEAETGFQRVDLIFLSRLFAFPLGVFYSRIDTKIKTKCFQTSN